MARLEKALLLAAGLGTRLAPLTDAFPKCLMPINGRPLLGLWLDTLLDAGFLDIVVNTHHEAQLLERFIEQERYCNHVHLSYEPELLGTAGTLLKHRDRFGSGPLLLAHADNLSLFDPLLLARKHADRPDDVVMTMMTFETQQPQLCGIVETGAEGRVVAFHEKQKNPPGNLANAAIYVVEPDVARMAEAIGRLPLDLSVDVIPTLLPRIQTFDNALYHRDIGAPMSLALAQFEFPLALNAARASGLRIGSDAPVSDWSWAGEDVLDAFRRALRDIFSPGEQARR
jgi:mannose-1-phosphate guanylyltransferase